MNNSKYIYAISFVIGCLILSIGIVKQAKTNRSFDRTVVVKGLCEKQVEADKVIWPISYKIGGNDLNNLYSEVDLKNNKIKGFLTKAGISEDEITISALNIEDNMATTYNNNAPFHYVITSVVTVCTGNIDLVLKLQNSLGDLISQGVPVGTGNSWENRTVFSFTKLNDIKPEMIEEATRNARAAAEKFAKDSHSSLGKIKTATQGQFSIEDRDSNTPHIKNVRVVTSVVYYLND